MATFLLLLAGGVVALLFAVRLVAAAIGSAFSPFPYITPGGHASLAWLLLAAMGALAALLWLVLRHDGDAVWLPSPGGQGGVLAPRADLERYVSSAAGRSHPDVVRAQTELRQRGGKLHGRIRVWARPLADPTAVSAAVEAAARRQAGRLTGLEVARADVRVKVLRVGQLVRYLP